MKIMISKNIKQTLCYNIFNTRTLITVKRKAMVSK